MSCSVFCFWCVLGFLAGTRDFSRFFTVLAVFFVHVACNPAYKQNTKAMEEKSQVRLQSICFSKEECDHVISRTSQHHQPQQQTPSPLTLLNNDNSLTFSSSFNNFQLLQPQHQQPKRARPHYQCRCYHDGEVTIDTFSSTSGMYPSRCSCCILVVKFDIQLHS